MLQKMNVNSTLRSYSCRDIHACSKFYAYPQDTGLPLRFSIADCLSGSPVSHNFPQEVHHVAIVNNTLTKENIRD